MGGERGQNSEFYSENEKKFFFSEMSIKMLKNLSLGFWVTKIKIDTAGACFPKS